MRLRLVILRKQSSSLILRSIYRRLFTRYGPQHWWPGETPFEVIIGAILTQSTIWTNAAKAIANLKLADVLAPASLRQLPTAGLAQLIRPSGYYNAKAAKVKAFVEWLGATYCDDLERVARTKTGLLRQQLLSIHGIGEETADSIILYALIKPVFVIDTYTRRIISRVGLFSEKASYAAWQSFFTDNLALKVRTCNEYHALLVALGKDVCHKQPHCTHCSLRDICHFPLA